MTATHTPITAREQVVGRPLAVVLCLLTVFGRSPWTFHLAVGRPRKVY